MPTHARKHSLLSSLVFHVYNRSNNRVHIFSEEADCRKFLHLLTIYKGVHHLRIYHWCIMRTHFHLLLEMTEPRRISSLMAGIGRAYSDYHHKAHGTSGFLWQGRFGLQPVQKERYLLACGRYIERNPVRARVVEDAGLYRFSSARFYCLGTPDGVTSEDPTYSRFGTDPIRKRAGYRLFLQDFDADEESLFSRGKKPVGDPYFTGRLRSINGRIVPCGRGRPKARISI